MSVEDGKRFRAWHKYLGDVRKTERELIRLSLTMLGKTPGVSLRVWALPYVENAEYIPTRKGMFVPLNLLGDVHMLFEEAMARTSGGTEMPADLEWDEEP